MCETGETCSNCPADCGVCPCAHGVCQAGAPLETACDPCVTQLCAQYPSCCSSTWGSACVAQVPTVCGQSCGGGPVCGNGTCEPSETCSTCPGDCGACPPVCGNGTCESGEDCASCPGDCGACPPVCGNGTCESGETCSTCPGDCGTCGPVCHDVCTIGPALDPSCDFCADFVCNIYGDPYCCINAWDVWCVDEANTFCAFCY